VNAMLDLLIIVTVVATVLLLPILTVIAVRTKGPQE